MVQAVAELVDRGHILNRLPDVCGPERLQVFDFLVQLVIIFLMSLPITALTEVFSIVLAVDEGRLLAQLAVLRVRSFVHGLDSNLRLYDIGQLHVIRVMDQVLHPQELGVGVRILEVNGVVAFFRRDLIQIFLVVSIGDFIAVALANANPEDAKSVLLIQADVLSIFNDGSKSKLFGF